MITHVVMFKLHETPDKAAIQRGIKQKLEALPAKIDVILSYEVGINVLPSQRAYDMMLVSTFESLETLAQYNAHPAHVEHLQYIRDASASIVAVDYES